ncbi:hypothetical protein Mgra_00001407 [Meloidogyne graminicola]|uniref:Uncharacterized protein n=1 Tax=Meloidogyne graminicola TaxID=189291 RepID=A0A8S9ZZH2_9BILA|nr:hypothetical protein Mgra_00001407 [Meloidogyne graminicola]
MHQKQKHQIKRTYFKTSSLFSLKNSFFFNLLILFLLIDVIMAEHFNFTNRAKRQYYDENYYSSYYGWQAGRIVGWLIGFFVLLLFICVPCICCAGIWFLGWFGVRQTMANRRARRDEGRVISARDQREIHRRYVEGTHSPVAAEQRYIHSSDRYYERRPRSPPPITSTENGPIRETRRL